MSNLLQINYSNGDGYTANQNAEGQKLNFGGPYAPFRSIEQELATNTGHRVGKAGDDRKRELGN